jgi:hypothetical protein
MAIVTTPSGAQVDSVTGALISGPPSNVNSNNLSAPQELKMPTYQSQSPQELQGIISAVPTFAEITAQFNQPSQEEQNASLISSQLVSRLNDFASRGVGVGEDGTLDTSLVTRQREMEAGIPTKSRDLQSVIGRINQLKAESLAIPLQIQEEFAGRGATAGGVEPIQTGKLRQNAIQSLTLSAQASALQGDIALAQQQIKDAIDIEFGREQINLNYLRNAYEMNKDALERTDKKKADAMRFALDERTRLLDVAKQDRQAKDTLGIKLAELGLDSSAVFSSSSYSEALKSALPQLAQKAQDDIRYEGLMRDAELELRRINIDNARLNGEKIAADILAEKNKSKIAGTDKEAETEKALALFSQVSKVANMPGKSSAVGFGVKKNVFTRTAAGAATGAGVGAAAGAPFAGVGAIPGAIGGAVLGGVSGFFAGPEALEGSNRADFEAQAERLANLLTVDNLDLMKGVLSETDIKILESAGSVLGNFDVSEKEYDEELQRIKEVSERNYKKLGITDEQAQFWFGITEDDIQELDMLMGNTTAPTGFNPNSYYK